MVKLPESHPLKKWMKQIGRAPVLEKKLQEKRDFLLEIITSKFNLITDGKLKRRIVRVLYDFPENTLPEILLKSYLYLMVGNVTRSDNILKTVINSPPRVSWEKSMANGSLYHSLAKEQFAQLINKFSRHPADRKTFQLFALYLKNFYNDEQVLSVIEDVDVGEVESKIGLKFVEMSSPAFIHFLRAQNLSETKRITNLRNIRKNPLEEQSYWVWAFLDVDPLFSEQVVPELVRLEKEDQLWFIYLMHNEKLADLYSSKAGKSFLPGRRPYLKDNLLNNRDFMMSLYKLIELGDINEDLIQRVSLFFTHE